MSPLLDHPNRNEKYVSPTEGIRCSRYRLPRGWTLPLVLAALLLGTSVVGRTAQAGGTAIVMAAPLNVLGAPNSNGEPAGEPGNVVDLCQIPKPKAGYVKPKVVFFDLAGREVTEEPETEVNDKGQPTGATHAVFRDAQVHDQIRNVFFGNLPMPRLHSLVAQVTAPPRLKDETKVSHEEMLRAAELDTFAAYSMACADWVFVPRVSKKSAKWSRVQKERQRGKQTEKYWAWSLSTSLEVELALFRFTNGGWTREAVVSGDGSKIGPAVALAMQAETVNQLMEQVNGGDKPGLASLVSAQPEPSCKVPLVDDLQEIAKGFTDCSEATLSAVSQAQTALDLNVKDEEDEDKDNEDAKDEKSNSDTSDVKAESNEPTSEADDGRLTSRTNQRPIRR